jgi:hypothetical protein
MMEFTCRVFLTAFLFFYSALFLALLGRIIRGALHGRPKRICMSRASERIGELAFSPPPRRELSIKSSGVSISSQG